MWSYSRFWERNREDPSPNGNSGCIYLLCKCPPQSSVPFQRSTVRSYVIHSQISEAEIWGLRNRFIVLPIIVAAIHMSILFSGTIVKAALWEKRVFVLVIVVTYRNLPFAESLLYWSAYSSDTWVDLRNLVIVCVTPGVSS